MANIDDFYNNLGKNNNPVNSFYSKIGLPEPKVTAQPVSQPIQQQTVIQSTSQKPKNLLERLDEFIGNKLNALRPVDQQSPHIIPPGAKERILSQPKEYFLPTSSSIVGQTVRKYGKDTLTSAINAVNGITKLSPSYLIYRATQGKPVTPKEYAQTLINTPLETLNTVWHLNPLAPIFGAVSGEVKTLRQKIQQKGTNLNWNDVADILEGATRGVAEQPGVGSVITDNQKIAQAIDIAFMATMISRPFVNKKLNSLNIKAPEIAQASKTLGIKPTATLKEVERAYKTKVKTIPDAFTNNPSPKSSALRTELTNAFNILKKAGVIDKNYTRAWEFINSKLGVKTQVTPPTPKALGDGTAIPTAPSIPKAEIKPLEKSIEVTKPIAEKPVIPKDDTKGSLYDISEAIKNKEEWKIPRDIYAKSPDTMKWANEAQGQYSSGMEKNYAALKWDKNQEINANLRLHKTLVKEALEAGKPVPVEVLKDYPELQRLYKNVAQPPISDIKPKEVLKPSVEIKPKVVEVPREQIPVGEGKLKVSRLEQRVTQQLNKTPEQIKEAGGAVYREVSKKENIVSASKYVIQNPEEALAVLKGEKSVPKGLLKNSIYVAMQNYAKGDVELARRLASISSTRYGQEISILSEIDKDNPINLMREIVDIREQTFLRKYKGKSVSQVRKNIVKDIKSKVKKVDKYDWNRFIDSIPTC